LKLEELCPLNYFGYICVSALQSGLTVFSGFLFLIQIQLDDKILLCFGNNHSPYLRRKKDFIKERISPNIVT